jgi:chaperonin cofactor prefoldin
MNPEDLKKYTALEVANLVDLDWHAVRDEGARRQDLAQKKIDRLNKQLERARQEMAEAQMIITTALNHR